MLGTHIIGLIKNCDKDKIKSKIFLKKCLYNASRKSKLKIVNDCNYQFKKFKGITYCLLLSQSHFIIHSWPEKETVSFDIFTCGEEKKAESAVKALAKNLNGKVTMVRKTIIK